MHWSEQVVKKILKRGKEQVVETGTSISGIPHIGNASDVIRGDAVKRALEKEGITPRFIWVADDSDPFRKVPNGMNLEEYLGFPVHDIPDPEECHENFVEHFVQPFLNNLEKFGISPEYFSATELYRSGAFTDKIRLVLDKEKEIKEILSKFYDEVPENYIAWQPICNNCGKISTPQPLERNADLIKYKCQETEVRGGKVEGCGNIDESDIKNGYGKLPWRIEWAMRWAHFQVTCEPLGKEHASSGGSFWTARLVSDKIFDWQPPEGVIYEFFTLNGEKISSSKGNVITLVDWLEICEPEVLRYFMFKRLNKQRDIKLKALPQLVDEYDREEQKYFEGKKAKEYELSQINEPKPLNVPFTLCAVLGQIDLDEEKLIERVKEMGYQEFSSQRLIKRVNVAANWQEYYGPQHLQVDLIEEKKLSTIKDKLTPKQIQALKELSKALNRKWNGEDLHKKIYDVARNHDLKPSQFFGAIYLVLLGKERGPKAANFILSLGKKFVKERFQKVVDLN